MAMPTPTIDNLCSAARQLGHDLRPETPCMGTHLLVEMWRSPFPVLANAQIIGKALDRVGREGDGTIDATNADVRVHQFSPYGVSGTSSGPTAHILIHTWPENKYAAIDIYARGRESAYHILDHIKQDLQPEYVHVIELRRGQLLEMEDT